MRRGWQRATCVALAYAACMLGRAHAVAAPAWLSEADLSLIGHNASVPHIVLDARGNAVAVWTRNDGSNFITQAAVRPAGENWQAPVNLSNAGRDTFDAEVAIDARGDAVAVWHGSDGTNDIVQAAARPAGGVWQAPIDLSAGGHDAFNPQVVLDAQGDAVAVWQRSNGSNSIVQGAVRPSATGVWQAAVDLSAGGGNALNPQIAVDARGDAVVDWQRFDGTNFIAQAAERLAASGVWQAPVDLSVAGQSADLPAVAVTPDGTAVAVWERFDGADEIAQAALRPTGGVWQSPVDLSAPGQNANNVEVAVDARGDVAAVWVCSNGINGIVQATVRPAGTGGWTSPVDLSVTGQSAAIPQIALDSQGDAIVTWERSNGSNEIVQTAVRQAGATFWRAPGDLSAAGQNAGDPQIAVDGQGNVAAVWQRSNGANTLIQAAGYDAAGPLLDGVSVPASGIAGVPVSFSVSPLDVWSPVASTGWRFGDGQGAAGARVSHTYSAPGAYAVTLTSADTLANSTSATASIAITPAHVAISVPTLTNVTQTHRRWREGRGAATLARQRPRRLPIGTQFAFTVDQTVRVGLTFTQRVHGRTVTRGTLGHVVGPGRRRVGFQGRIGKRRLPVGAYALQVTAVNATTGLRSRRQTLHFTIVG